MTIEQAWSWAPASHVLLACLVFALARRYGAAPERMVAGTLLAASALRVLYTLAPGAPRIFAHLDLGMIWFEGLVLLALWTIALCAHRLYPLWVGAAQIIIVASYFNPVLLAAGTATTDAIIRAVMIGGQLGATVAGVWSHVVRTRRLGGVYLSWSGRSV